MLVGCGWVLFAGACVDAEPDRRVTDSRTGEWGIVCDSEQCAGDLECLCGTCTARCGDVMCPSGFECVDSAQVATCSVSEGPICLRPCEESAECGVGAACDGGFCVAAPNCTLELGTPIGQFTEAVNTDTDCDCAGNDLFCRAALQLRVVRKEGRTVDVEMRLGPGADVTDASVVWGTFYTLTEQLTCGPVADAAYRNSGTAALATGWAGTEVLLNAPTEFQELPDGATVWLHAAAGSALNPSLPIYYSGTGIAVTKRCATE